MSVKESFKGGQRSPAVQVAALAIAALPPSERAALLADMAPTPAERVLSREEVAARFGVTQRAVDQWVARGVLRKLRLPGSRRAIGFRSTDVENLLRG